MDRQIILIDAGTGNLRSVRKALQEAGAAVQMTSDPDEVVLGDPVILPGVGAFGNFMQGLRSRGLFQAVQQVRNHGTPILGICVGMQAMFSESLEIGAHLGFSYLEGKVVRFPDIQGLKIPHTGWNQLDFRDGQQLLSGIDPGSYVYFNHSYYCRAEDEADILAWTDHGVNFPSAVQHENLFGVQFHPEKSQRVGLKVLTNFIHRVAA